MGNAPNGFEYRASAPSSQELATVAARELKGAGSQEGGRFSGRLRDSSTLLRTEWLKAVESRAIAGCCCDRSDRTKDNERTEERAVASGMS